MSTVMLVLTSSSLDLAKLMTEVFYQIIAIERSILEEVTTSVKHST